MSRPATRAVTLIELLIIVVIIGMLLTIFISRFVGRKPNDADGLLRQQLGLRQELSRLSEAQQAYRSAHQRYAADLSALSLTATPGITITILGGGLESGTGWSATARSTDPEDLTCYLGVGVDTVVDAVTVTPNQVVCKSAGR